MLFTKEIKYLKGICKFKFNYFDLVKISNAEDTRYCRSIGVLILTF